MHPSIKAFAIGIVMSFSAVSPSLANLSDLHIEITSECVAGNAVFEVHNLGAAWPGAAKLQVVRTRDDRTVRRRETTIAVGDRATFVIPGVARSGVELGVRISSEWARFSQNTLANLKCGG